MAIIGDIQCVAISDGAFSYPTGWFFSNVPQEQLETVSPHGTKILRMQELQSAGVSEGGVRVTYDGPENGN